MRAPFQILAIPYRVTPELSLFCMKISSVRFAWNGGNLHGQLQNGYRNPTTVPTEISPFRSAASRSKGS